MVQEKYPRTMKLRLLQQAPVNHFMQNCTSSIVVNSCSLLIILFVFFPAFTAHENLYDQNVNHTIATLMSTGSNVRVEAATNEDHRQGLLRDNCNAHLCCYMKQENPMHLQLAGSNKFQEKLLNGDTSKDPSAYSQLKNKKNRFASLANMHVNRMKQGFEKSGQSTNPIWCVLQTGYSHKVKCLTTLVPRQDNGSGGVCTEENVMNSFKHPTHLAAAAGG